MAKVKQLGRGCGENAGTGYMQKEGEKGALKVEWSRFGTCG